MSERVAAWGLVSVQVVLLVAVLLVPSSDDWPAVAAVGGVLIVVGAALGIWAIAVFGRGVTPSPLPASSASLVTRGPYRWVRHPMYSAVFVACAGVVVRSRNWAGFVVVVVLVGFFAFKARWEEHRLVATYPGYAEYAARVGRFVPGVGRLSG